MDTPTTLFELLDQAGLRQRWFDLGRRLQPVPRKVVESFEAGDAPWPHPYLQQAWLGLLLWFDEDKQTPIVWFLRLPLDEQGKLRLSERDAFLRRLLQSLADAGDQDPAAGLQRALDGSEVIYTPAEDRRAVFHARAALALAQKPGPHFGATMDYLRSEGKAGWQNLAMQGIADVSVRWQEQQELLEQQLELIEGPVFIALCQCLESEAIPHQLCERIIRRARAERATSEPNFGLIAAAVRGVSNSAASGMRRDFLIDLLGSEAGANVEVLAALASRCCTDFEDDRLAALWLSKAAEHLDQSGFNLLLSDLMYLPEVRNRLLQVIRSPDRDEVIAAKFGAFLRGASDTPGSVH
ncbi:DUF3549 family protein [Biformimicrobium ophioploci]|uniref:DUF3549 family protein n=1 Tax=Biformimicrobium ophioploci TaxID=3036711 RepID=A0ABQ6LZ44_9GAMM|nr:DUF3549 family protein [Microbulbifer sp. NKW57]GMG87371.1 DUF3549 family protein [Microbulbifer sp. NKW57]